MEKNTTKRETVPDILTSYLEENSRVKDLLAEYQEAKEVIRQADEAAASYGSLYPFYSYSSNT